MSGDGPSVKILREYSNLTCLHSVVSTALDPLPNYFG